MGRKKKDNDIIVSFIGGSQNEVTGSCVSISYPKNNNERGLIIIECGLCQSEPTIEKLYNANKRMIDNIGKEVIQSAEYVLIGHCHIDHIGNLSIFNDDNGFKGKILGSHKTIELGKQLLKDSVYIHGKNIEYLKSIGRKPKPFYTEQQMYQTFNHFESVPVNKEIILNDNVKVIFHTNSHVVGSCSISIIIRKPNNQVKHILYSSDMGSKINKEFQPFLDDINLPSRCNLFISEATYNDKDRQIIKRECIEERKQLKEYIKNALNENKRILFATFSFSRSQLLLTMIYEWFKDEEWFEDIPVIVDGLLMNNINNTYLNILEDDELEYFKNVLQMKNIKFNKHYDSTIATLSKRQRGIYITASGFCTGGRITTYLPQFLESSKDVIILTGFSGVEGSIGSKILNVEQKTVTIDKKVISKRAEIKQLRTFSSHISYKELLELWNGMKCDKILVHHSSEDGKYKIVHEAKEYLSSKGNTTPIIAVDKGCNQFVL